MNVVLSVSIEIIKRSTFMLYPIIPSSCTKIFDILNINIKDKNFVNIKYLPKKSFKINISKPIFPRIEIND